MRVCVVPTDTWGVGSYRVLQPARELERHGHLVYMYLDQRSLERWRPHHGNQPLRNSFPVLGENLAGLRDPRKLPRVLPDGFDADVYVIQRRLERWMPFAIARLRDLGKAVVTELDDLYDALPESSPGRRPLETQKHIFSLDALNAGLRYSELVTVSTPALAEHYSRYNPNVRVLPNYLDWEMWEPVEPQYEVERHRVRVGWMGWLDWRDTDLEILREFMRDWLLANPHVEFVSIGERSSGGKQVHSYLGVPRGQRISYAGVPYRRLPEIVATIDIGLVPLARNQFNECKSWLKGLEYAACGIPCIATPTQQYRQFVRDGVDGFLAETADEWRKALDELVRDDERRRQMGRAARAKAARMTIQQHWHEWEDAYASVRRGPHLGKADARADARLVRVG